MRMSLASVAAIAAVAGSTQAQFDNQWVGFQKSPSSLNSPMISDGNTETDVIWGDLDKDGDDDLVIVRKQPFTSLGKRTNLLLMNEGGVLTDRTIEFATASDVVGDLGFRTPTNDRDVVLADVDGDSWLDVITATTLSDGDPKHIGHPRIYMNLGNDGGGNWLGLEFQADRTPQFFHFSNGQAHNPRFCSVIAGDVTGDGAPDLYFGDYDSGASSSSTNDLNDRLLINDGNGFFSDESQARMTSQMLLSAFGTAVDMEDMNGDGTLDIIKDTALNAPQYVAISYNNALGVGNEGEFNFFDNSGVGSGAPYHVDVGDLNNDGRADIITSDDGLDRFRFNLGNDALDRAEFSGGSGGHTYDFLTGGDDGFASNNLIIDLDGDGWADTIHADVDVDIPGGNRRMHIYHNLGGQSGASPGDIITLREERESAGGGGWIGAVGIFDADLRQTHDFAVMDINLDGALDLFISRADGADVYLADADVCQPDLGFGGGVLELSVCGDVLDSAEGRATVEVTGADPSGVVFLLGSFSSNPVPLFDGSLVPNPLLLSIPVVANPDGDVSIDMFGDPTPVDFFLQAATDSDGKTISNAVRIEFGS